MMNTYVELFRANKYSLPLEITDENGNPYNLTGTTILFTIKKIDDNSLDDLSALVKKTITIHTDPGNGVTSVDLNENDTNLEFGIYRWDVKIIDGSLDPNTDTGFIKIIQKTTYRTQ